MSDTESDYRWANGAAKRALIVVTGSHRDDVPREHVEGWLDADRYWLTEWFHLPISVLHGAAPGVDTYADEWARRHGIEVSSIAADWSQGQAAGSARNSKLLAVAIKARTHGWVPVLRAFPGPHSKGTWDMVRKWRAANLSHEVRTLSQPPPPDLFARKGTTDDGTT